MYTNPPLIISTPYTPVASFMLLKLLDKYNTILHEHYKYTTIIRTGRGVSSYLGVFLTSASPRSTSLLQRNNQGPAMDHSDSWYMLNLWENYDEELLERFSREMVVPNYKKEGKITPSHSISRLHIKPCL